MTSSHRVATTSRSLKPLTTRTCAAGAKCSGVRQKLDFEIVKPNLADQPPGPRRQERLRRRGPGVHCTVSSFLARAQHVTHEAGELVVHGARLQRGDVDIASQARPAILRDDERNVTLLLTAGTEESSSQTIGCWSYLDWPFVLYASCALPCVVTHAWLGSLGSPDRRRGAPLAARGPRYR